MKRLALACAALALFILFGAPAVTHAAKGALCWADSYNVAQGETTGIYCSGFTPLKYISLYLVEPDGTAAAYGSVKSDADGNIVFGWGNGVKNQYSYPIGTFTFVAQELGLKNEILVAGKIEIRNTGDGDHVSGAYLDSDRDTYDRTQSAVVLTGWGFGPNEMVTLWIQRPALCSSYTGHYVDGKNGQTFENVDLVDVFGTYPVGDVKTDSAGSFYFVGFFANFDCQGTWRYAARGNASGLGAYKDINVTGHAVSTNAWLVPDKDRVGAFNDTIQFHATGFGANEILNCWTTSPDGRAIPFGLPSSLGQIKVGADGSGVISLTTGAHIITPDDFYFQGVTVEPVLSEGSLGVWNMTCKGATTGATAIAEYTVYGYEMTP